MKLRAVDEEDLKVVSACLQDAVAPIADMAFLPAERSFVLVVSRFRWEALGGVMYERVLCGIRIEGVERVRLRGFDLRDRDRMLDLLAVEPVYDAPGAAVPGALVLYFAGSAAIRLEVRNWLCHLEDIGEPWPTTRCPFHMVADDPFDETGPVDEAGPAGAAARFDGGSS